MRFFICFLFFCLAPVSNASDGVLPTCDEPEVKGAVYDLFQEMFGEFPGGVETVGAIDFDAIKELKSNKKARICEAPFKAVFGEDGRVRYLIELHPNERQYVVKILY